MNNILLLLLFHFIADFVMQSREMGRNKSKSIDWLSLHVVTYTAALIVLCQLTNLPPESVFVFALINGTLHWVTDFFTSKASSYCYKRTEDDKDKWEHLFWCVIGFDQLIHTTTLILTFQYIFV